MRRDHSPCAPGRRVRAAGERSRHRTDHLQRYGGRDRNWRGVLQRSRLRRLAGTRAKADLDRGSHNPGQDIKRGNRYLRVLFVQAAWVVLNEAEEMGGTWAQTMDRERPRNDCIATCWRSRLPINWRGSLGAFWLVDETSRRGGPWDQSPSLQTLTCRGLREDETRWRFGLAGACEHW